MNLRDIVVGGEYYVGGTAMGKARIISHPVKKHEGTRIYEVEVEYPDALPTVDEDHRKTKIETKDIFRLWNEQDQERFEEHRRRIEDKRGWEDELRIAGFDGVVNMYGGGIVLTFRNLNAERVLEKLTGAEFPENQKIRNARA